MRLQNLNTVNQIVREINELKNDLEHVTGKGLGVTFQGRYQNEEILSLVRPHIVAFLNKEIAKRNNDLKQLGVEL